VQPGDVIFGIPDLHSPFFHQGWYKWVLKVITEAVRSKRYRRVIVVQLGDAYDIYGLTRHEKIFHVNPKKEINMAAVAVKQMWDHLMSLGCIGYQLIGNHDARTEKYILRNEELRAWIPSVKSLLTFDGVFTVDSERDAIEFNTGKDTIQVMHGYLSDSLQHVRKHNTSIMHAHLHQGGLRFANGKFALDCAYGGDHELFPFAYTVSAMRKDWQRGMGRVEVDENGILHPFFLRCVE
jgi:hypothetical protein